MKNLKRNIFVAALLLVCIYSLYEIGWSLYNSYACEKKGWTWETRLTTGGTSYQQYRIGNYSSEYEIYLLGYCVKWTDSLPQT